ncbi:Glu-tRNA(Gln) amidotransferase subunit GatD [Candidatus Pacearchaeota archaeon]|nr:Glu-tRNA(Gln) amidotransferase subunit GatD [Candidatus Pacearchaeota archaeon]
MKTKTFSPGDKVALQTKSKLWKGYALESHDSEVILLKLESGYNIGIREGEILNAKVLEKAKPKDKKEVVLEKNPKLRNVVVIITGGTISSRLDYKSGGVIPTDAEDILNIAPEIKNVCNVTKIDTPFMKFSEDMSPSDWKKLAETCEPYLNDKSVDGIIITHGTDTLHYTAAALSFFIQNLNKPIALTYSQRSIDRASTDAALNLICSARYAISDIAEIALVGHKNSDDKICVAMPATKVRKLHTSRRDAFKIVNDTPIAEITSQELKILKTFNARSNNKPKLDTKFQDKVTLIKIHPGQDPSIIEYYEQQGYNGLIIETTGLGQVPGKFSSTNWIPKIKKAIQKGITVCATAQTIYGRLNPNVYSSGRELKKTGIIFLEDMLSETALIKLGWVLGHKNWNSKEKMSEKASNS